MPHRGLALVLFGLSLAGCGRAPSARTATSADDAARRAALVALRDEVAALSSDQQNARDRAERLLPLANQQALAGWRLPIGLLPGIANVINAPDGAIPPDLLAELDGAARELALKEEHPDGIGSFTFAAPPPPFAVRSFATFELTYRVGALGVAPGGALVVGMQMMSDCGALQVDQPAQDNLITARASRPGATLRAATQLLPGPHGGFRETKPMPRFVLEGERLLPGDTVTLVYGDRSGGGRGLRMQSFDTDEQLLPVYVDVDGSGRLLTPREWTSVRVVGGGVLAVDVTVPSVVAAGETFAIAVRSRDGYYNRATGPLPAYTLFLAGSLAAGQPFRELPAGGEALQVIADARLEAPGVHRFAIRSSDGALTATSNPVRVERSPSHRVFWGETHGHTGYAEGQGTPEQYFRFGKEDAALDFLSLSEHDIWLDDAEWQVLQRLATEHSAEGRFVAFLGYEWSARRARGGHHNVFFRDPDRERVPVHIAGTLPALYRELHARYRPDEVLVIPHAHQLGDWTTSDPELERLVEIYSMHGTFEWFGNLYLKKGWEVGFVGASDDHRARPGLAHGITRAPLAQYGGLAAVRAERHSREAIWRALRGLAAYATSGQRILLDATLNGRPMGSRQGAAAERHLVASVAGTAPIERIDLIKNGTVVLQREYARAPLASRVWLQVGFESSSDVFAQQDDNPRPYRIWQGTIEIEGARLLDLRDDGFENVYLEGAKLSANDPQTVEFHTETRGRRDVLLLLLDGASTTTRLRFHLEPTRESGFSPILVRPPADLPGADFELALSALDQGTAERPFTVDDHTDTVTVQAVDPAAPLDQSIELRDLASGGGDPRAGDYYYLRVTQLDGGRAWSSPWWVGGTAPRPAAR